MLDMASLMGQLIAWFSLMWVGSGIIFLLIDCVKGFPKALGDRHNIDKIMLLVAEHDGKDARKLIVFLVFITFVIHGPTCYQIEKINFEFKKER